MSENRLTSSKPDFVLTIVRKPEHWRPRNYFDKPPHGKVLSKSLIASYEEAHDDLVRCNRLALYESLDTWAVIQSAADNATLG
ncbi:MAG: hypothetical protein ACI87E_003310 [Mariniblastus sp.]|jgi:hypothetical protein